MDSKTNLTLPEEIDIFVCTYRDKIRPALNDGDFRTAIDAMFPVFLVGVVPVLLRD